MGASESLSTMPSAEGDTISRLAMEYDVSEDDDEDARIRFTWTPYWQWQEVQWSMHYDAVAGGSMLFMLLCNIASRYNPQPELFFARFRVRAAAMLAICGVLFGLWLRSSDRTTYIRLRRWILLLQYCIVAPMVYWVNIAAPQGQSPHTLLSVLQIVYRNGNLLCVVLASTLRMPWQRMAALNAAFVLWVAWAWVPLYCSQLVNSQDYTLQRNKHFAILNAAASGLDYVSGRGAFAGNNSGQWQSAAHSMLLHCGLAGNGSSSSYAALLSSTGGRSSFSQSSSQSQTSGAATLQQFSGQSSSSLTGSQTPGLTGSETANLTSLTDCHALLEGQCMAIVSTFNIWWGLCFTTLLLVIAEQLSKWQWLHTHGSWMMPGAPSLFRAGSKATFLRSLLLRLHCVLDVPLLLLWAGFSTAYTGSFGGS